MTTLEELLWKQKGSKPEANDDLEVMNYACLEICCAYYGGGRPGIRYSCDWNTTCLVGAAGCR